MLEIKNLLKIYRPKKGVPVKAIDGVSLKFADKGMVFLLGKSGSGKSTLLNLLGGLDKYDGGEIIIKGVSSKSFKQKHFDSYRNTYVGFIFQEYNILEEFTVGANIALAIELQGRKATNEELNNILNEVDLAGYGNRRPNELSGGQKQRVAIARALVKNPKIIMADEPSGALDSVTGKQVFDTLKKLSKDKLVIVVSHDRDFANEYADRIIELADGRVISDTSIDHEAIEEPENQGISFEGNMAKIPLDYRLTEEDRIAINEYLDKIQQNCELEFVKTEKNKKFVPTLQEDIKSEDNSPFKLIKSKLFLKHAFKIGASGLKHKKFRLVMTIFLSCIAFVLFGLVDTFSSYNHIKATTDSVYDTGITYASLTKGKLRGDEDYSWYSEIKISDSDLKTLKENTGIDFLGVLSNASNFSQNVYKKDNDSYYYSYYELYTKNFSGIAEISDEVLSRFGYEIVAGSLPDGNKNQIAVSKYIAETFKEYGYVAISYDAKDDVYTEGTKITINNYSEMIGKTLMISNTEYEITAVIDTKFDWSRYEQLLEEANGDATDAIIDFVLYNEFISATEDNLTGMMMVGDGFIQRFLDTNGNFTSFQNASTSFESADKNGYYFHINSAAKLSDVDKSKIVWLDGEKSTLGEKEMVISAQLLENYFAYYDENGNLQIDENAINATYTLNYYSYDSFDSEIKNDEGFKIVGYINTGFNSYDISYGAVISDEIFNKYVTDDKGIYNLALGAMPQSKSEIENLAEYCYTDRDGFRYSFNNPASYQLDTFDEGIEIIAKVCLWIGVFFAVFASILLSNFIATSISYKKQEIGILRAIGSRGNDVFRIFFSEAFIIAMINFVIACIGTGLITAAFNSALREELGVLVTVLHFGIRQVSVLFLISVAVAFIASFIPVKKIASKRPIDAIRNR